MKIDNERPYHSSVFHELVSSGGPKVDGEPEREAKDNLQADKLVEQTNAVEHTFVKAEHQNGGKTRQIRIEDISYDKDVVEINLPDGVVSSDYGGHFVKDVCVDEGVLAEQKASAEKGEKVCQNFDSSTGDANGDLMEDIRVDPVKAGYKSQIVTLHVAHATDGNTMEKIKVDPVKIAHEVKPQTVTLHAACATDTMEQYSPCEVRDLEVNTTTDDITNLNVEKLSPTQLSSHEAAKQCQQKSTVIVETFETHKPFCEREASYEVASNDCHEIGASIAPEASNLNGLAVESTSDGFPAAISEGDVGAELDERGLNPASHYNPFIAYGSLEETWEAKYALPSIVDSVSVVPICPVGKTDSFSDLVNGGALGGFDFVETAECRIGDSRLNYVGARSSTLDARSSEESHDERGSLVERIDSFSDLVNGAGGGFDSIVTDDASIKHSRLDSIEESSGRLDVQPSEESNDQREGPVNETRTEGAHGTGTSDAEPSDAKNDDHPKCETDNFEDAQDFNPRDMEEDGTDVMEDKKGGKSSRHAQTEYVVQQNGHDSAKLMARTGMRNPFESSFSGASITSDALAPSAHIGNISLRSDSSTTSTRSFAFPVLQTEWNSSPVKMVKADRRRFRRDRGWGYRVLCCKF